MPRMKFLLIVMIFTVFVSGCGKSDDEIDFEQLEDLNKPSRTIGAVVGTASEPYVGKIFPNAAEKQFQDISHLIVALEQKQVDAIVFTRATLDTQQNKNYFERNDSFYCIDKRSADSFNADDLFLHYLFRNRLK